MASKSALIIGATGQVGQHVLKELLASSHYSKVGEYGRRVTELSTLSTGKEKLEQKIVNFEKLGESGIKDGKWDVVFITLGTTRSAAGSAQAFQKIDREYVVNSAREARVPGTEQRIVYCSSIGADPTSRFLYPQSKGLTELDIAGLGYTDSIVYRPAILAETHRPEHRLGESIVATVFGLASYVSSAFSIGVPLLGKSIVIAGFLGSEGLPPVAQAKKVGKDGKEFTLIGNSGAIALGNTPWE